MKIVITLHPENLSVSTTFILKGLFLSWRGRGLVAVLGGYNFKEMGFLLKIGCTYLKEGEKGMVLEFITIFIIFYDKSFLNKNMLHVFLGICLKNKLYL